MKKIFLAAAVGLLALGATSCNDTKDTTSGLTTAAYYHVNALNGTGTPVISSGNQSLEFNLTQGTATMTTTPFKMTLGQDVSIGFNNLPYKTIGYSYVVSNPSSLTADNGMAINNFNLAMTAFFMPPVNTTIQDLRFYSPVSDQAMVMSFELGSMYRVRTFWPDAVYCGHTNTSYTTTNNSQGSYSNNGIALRVKMDLSVDKDTGLPNYKATVVMYNAKFAEEQPFELKMLVLENLSIEFTNDGYTIKGENIIPKAARGGDGNSVSAIVPFEQYPFKSFVLTSSGDLSTIEASFKVGDRYEGKFDGFWALTPANVEKYKDMFSK